MRKAEKVVRAEAQCMPALLEHPLHVNMSTRVTGAIVIDFNRAI